VNKEDFPILLNNKNLVYLDSSATSLKPKQVIDEINNYYNFYTANLHRGDYDNAITVNKKVEETRVLVKEFLNAKEENEIIFTSGTTESLNMIVFSFMKYNLKENDEVLLTKTEHASNVLPWLVLEREIGIKVKYIPLKENLTIDYEKLKEIINDNTKVISIAHITNTVGDVREINKIRDIINNKNIYFVVDGAQSAGHIKVDVEESNIDFYAFSGHKMYADTGVGVLYAKKDLLEKMRPFKYGGGMNDTYTIEEYSLKQVPYKFDAGTVNISGILSLRAAIIYINSIGIENITNYISNLSNFLYENLKNIKNIKIYNDNFHTGIMIFNIDKVFSQDLSVFLNKYNICVRSGNHCSKLLKDFILISNTCRVSLNIYNTKEDILKLVEVLNKQEEIYENII
jgi:probable cysteine desulfurase